MKNLSKQIFLDALVCSTLGWYSRHEDNSEVYKNYRITLGDRFRMEQGIEIGKRARELYPDGILVSGPATAPAFQKTGELMKGDIGATIFEGAFSVGGMVARADILRRNDGGWHLLEVKSSLNNREEFIDDMAYTAMVIGLSGYRIEKVSLVLLSKDYRLGMGTEKLFVELDHTSEVLEMVEDLKPHWQQIEKRTGAAVKPEPELILECRNCPVFADCRGKGINNPIFNLPRLSRQKFDELKDFGIDSVEDILTGIKLTEYQARVRDCVLKSEPFVGVQLKDKLTAINWPVYYLDFEAFMTALPVYPDVAPYTQIPTQYSIHKCSDIDNVIDHFEYLADPARDCRRDLAEGLIHHLQKEGDIIIYSSFEKVVVNGLANLYPDLAERLTRLVERMVDLEAMIRKNFYHPDFHGSTSIKTVLPALVPDMSYNGLDIAEGDTAMAVFGNLALGKYRDREEIESLRRNLLKYCKQDTLAMVRLHEKLTEYV